MHFNMPLVASMFVTRYVVDRSELVLAQPRSKLNDTVGHICPSPFFPCSSSTIPVAYTCSQTESWNKLLPFSPKRPRDLWEDHLRWNVKGTSQRCFSFWDQKCLPNPEDWNALNILGSDTYGSTAAFGNLHPLPVKKTGKRQKSSYSARPAPCEVGDLIFWSIYIQPPYIPSYWKQNKVGPYLFLFKKNADLPPFQPNNSPGYKAINVPR